MNQALLALPSVFFHKQITILERTPHDVLKRPGPEVVREANGIPSMFAGECIFLTSVLKY